MEYYVNWEEKYYNEFDLKKRRALLENHLAEEEPSEELELIKKLFDARHTPVGKEPPTIDHMLKAFEILRFERPAKQGSRAWNKIKTKLMEILETDLAEPYGEMGKKVWFNEVKHMAKTYIWICTKDKTYTATLWGLGRMDDRAVAAKIAKNFKAFAYELPQRHSLAEELAEYSQAVAEAFGEMFPDYENPVTPD